ncbi:MAG: DUF4296 domain-containing protein [Ginsengibacter sp.]
MKRTFFIIMCCLLVSCSGKNKVPAEIIQPKEMQSILWDVIRAQALSTEIARKDSTTNEVTETKALNKKIYGIHKITPATFDKSYAWYTNHPDMMRLIFDSLNVQKQKDNELFMREKNTPKKIDSIKRHKISE